MNKLKIGFFSFLVALLCFSSFSEAVVLKFDLNVNWSENTLSHVHFHGGQNDFGGIFFWYPAEVLEHAETVQVPTTSPNPRNTSCQRRVRGLYYNSQRGERLWPLDEITKNLLSEVVGGENYDGLDVENGLYTACSIDEMGIYGILQHKYEGFDYKLIAGVNYDTVANNRVKSGSPLSATFQRFDNKIPAGYVFDYNGGLGFVGGKVLTGGDIIINCLGTSTGSVNSCFDYSGEDKHELKPITGLEDAGAKIDWMDGIGDAIDTLLLLKIKGIVGLSTDINKTDKSTLFGNEDNQKTQYFSSENINNATLLNYAKKTAEEFCKGKWSTSQNAGDAIWCLKGDVPLNVTNAGNKTVIVKEGNVTLDRMMDAGDKPLEIFIDKGNLLIPKSSSLHSFDDRGYISSSSGVSEGVYLKGNFIVNGLINGSNGTGVGYPNKLFLHGKFTSLNSYSFPSTGRVQQVNTVVSATSDQINLEKVFAWRCFLGTGTDDSACKLGEFRNSPFIIINADYPSRLVK